MIQKFRILFLSLSLLAGSAFAGTPPTPIIEGGEGSLKQTRAYAGLSWTLGAQKSVTKPDLVVGVQSIKVSSTDRVSNGVDLSARFKFTDNNLSYDSGRVSYLSGKRNLMTGVGVGYSATSKSYLGTVAANAAFSRLGLDFEFNDNKFVPYLELVTLSKPKRAGQGFTCSDDGAITNSTPALGEECRPAPP